MGEWLQASLKHIKALQISFALIIALGLFLIYIGANAIISGLATWSFLNTMAMACFVVGGLMIVVAALGLRGSVRVKADIKVYEAKEAAGEKDVESTPGQLQLLHVFTLLILLAIMLVLLSVAGVW